MFQSERERPGSKLREVDFHSTVIRLVAAARGSGKLICSCCVPACGVRAGGRGGDRGARLPAAVNSVPLLIRPDIMPAPLHRASP